MIGGDKTAALLRAPHLVGLFAHQPLEFGIAAGFGKLQEIELAALVKVHKLIVQLHIRISIARGQNPPDLGGNGDGAEKLQHTHPLVALLHIKAVPILVDLHRVPDPLLEVG